MVHLSAPKQVGRALGEVWDGGGEQQPVLTSAAGDSVACLSFENLLGIIFLLYWLLRTLIFYLSTLLTTQDALDVLKKELSWLLISCFFSCLPPNLLP